MADRYIPEHRRNFKAKGTFKPDELRRRREEQQVEIRKQKREENLAKRRNMAITSPAPGTGAESDEEGGNDTQVCFHAFFLFSRSFLRFFLWKLYSSCFSLSMTKKPHPFIIDFIRSRRLFSSHLPSLRMIFSIFPCWCCR